MGGEFSFDDYLMEREECDVEFTHAEAKAIRRAILREKAAEAAAERGE